MVDDVARPVRRTLSSPYLLPEAGVYLPGWACAVLDRMALDALRREVRGQHSDLDYVLGAVHDAALWFRVAAEAGSRLDATEIRSASSSAVDTTTAAARLGVSPRRVRQLIATGRLAATRIGSCWAIDVDTLTDHAALHRKAIA
jgi:excisionase family DNA binding protein